MEDLKLSPLEDDMILYIHERIYKNPQKTTRAKNIVQQSCKVQEEHIKVTCVSRYQK